jgi:D-arginine dehydrogenase
MAVAAHRVTEFTTLEVRRITHRWAGLRTFSADRVPVAGFDPEALGFFWLAGQGGYGLQTAPAMAEIVEALVTGGNWPDVGVHREEITPDRFL